MLRKAKFRQARPEDVAGLAGRLVEAGAFADAADVASQVRGRPWTIQVDDRRPAKRYGLVDEWRSGTGYAVIRHLSPNPRGRGLLIEHLTQVLRDQGFSDVLSPLLDDASRRPFDEQGFVERERLVVLKKRGTAVHRMSPVCEVRAMTAADAQAVAAIDEACFDGLWRLASADVASMLCRAAGFVAVQGGASIGYNMVSVSQEAGTIGRLAVSPDHRNQGVGSTLLAAGLGWLANAGASGVTLCTQHGNRASRRLYTRFGFERLPDDLSLMQRNL